MRRLRSGLLVTAMAALVAISSAVIAHSADAKDAAGTKDVASTTGGTDTGSAGGRTRPEDLAAAEAWGVSPSDQATMAAQSAALTIANELRRRLASRPGFTSIEIATGTVIVRWKGGVPPAAATVINAIARTAAKATPNGPIFSIKTQSAQYSAEELDAAAAVIRAAVEEGRGDGIHAIGVLADGSGLDVTIDTDPTAPGFAALQGQAMKLVASLGVTVPVAVTAGPQMRTLSRENDYAPWAGGAIIRDRESTSSYYNTTCTSGWGVRGTTGITYLLTAGHCGQRPDQFRDPTGEYIGRVSVLDSTHDIMLIQTQAAGEIYVGGPTGTTQSIKGVAGWSNSYLGQSICHSGAASGNLCGMVIEGTSDIRCGTTPTGSWKCYGPLLRARRVSGSIAGRSGDSGGPVYYPYGTRVAALGTVTGGDGGSLLWFTGFNWAYQNWGVATLVRSY